MLTGSKYSYARFSFLLLLLLVFLVTSSGAMPKGDFLPLEVGNQWTFRRYNHCCNTTGFFSGTYSIRFVKITSAKDSSDVFVYRLTVRDSFYMAFTPTSAGITYTPYSKEELFEAEILQLPDSSLIYSDSKYSDSRYSNVMMSLAFGTRYYDSSLIKPLMQDTMKLEVVQAYDSRGKGLIVARDSGPLLGWNIKQGELTVVDSLQLLDFNGRNFASLSIITGVNKRMLPQPLPWNKGLGLFNDFDALGRETKKWKYPVKP